MAVVEFGIALENAIQDIEGKNKNEVAVKTDRLVRKWLDMPLKFRNPVVSGPPRSPKAIED